MLPQLNLICSSDQLRPSMNHVKVTKDFCVATDGHCMGWFKTSLFFNDDFIDGIPDGCLVEANEWKELAKCDRFYWQGSILVGVGKKEILVRTKTENEIGRYPDWKAVIPSEQRERHTQGFPLDVALLYRLACALKDDGKKTSLQCDNYFSESQAYIVVPRWIHDYTEDWKEYGGICMPLSW